MQLTFTVNLIIIAITSTVTFLIKFVKSRSPKTLRDTNNTNKYSRRKIAVLNTISYLFLINFHLFVNYKLDAIVFGRLFCSYCKNSCDVMDLRKILIKNVQFNNLFIIFEIQ